MCTEHYTTKIYTCGDRIDETVKIDRCDDPSQDGHEVKRAPMASKKERVKCGRFGCINP